MEEHHCLQDINEVFQKATEKEKKAVLQSFDRNLQFSKLFQNYFERNWKEFKSASSSPSSSSTSPPTLIMKLLRKLLHIFLVLSWHCDGKDVSSHFEFLVSFLKDVIKADPLDSKVLELIVEIMFPLLRGDKIFRDSIRKPNLLLIIIDRVLNQRYSYSNSSNHSNDNVAAAEFVRISFILSFHFILFISFFSPKVVEVEVQNREVDDLCYDSLSE